MRVPLFCSLYAIGKQMLKKYAKPMWQKMLIMPTNYVVEGRDDFSNICLG